MQTMSLDVIDISINDDILVKFIRWRGRPIRLFNHKGQQFDFTNQAEWHAFCATHESGKDAEPNIITTGSSDRDPSGGRGPQS